MNPKYIIVQAGGRGSRMENLTRNKPKALVPVDNRPMLFHLFEKYPDKKYIIIGDYKYDVLEKYLRAFAAVDYRMVSGTGHTGTCAGLKEALDEVPEDESFMLIWCDLVLPACYEFPEEDGDYIGISKDFPCRWSYRDGNFVEERSSEYGVAGHFIFRDKRILSGVPEDGELVRWMGETGLKLTPQPLYRTKEYGLLSEWEKLPVRRCRPFNKIEMDGDRLKKIPVDEQGVRLAGREAVWYRKVSEYPLAEGRVRTPRIYGYEPLTMELVGGKNIYEYREIPQDEKKRILKQIVEALSELHSLDKAPYDAASFKDAYIDKTKSRLEKVRELVPFADRERIIVNGKSCRNIFFCWDKVEEELLKFQPHSFRLIHGDCTFSNIMLNSKGEPVFIDPRGYFGHTELYGDTAYDWVKLYYSLATNYDRFNLKQFNLDIGESEVFLEIESNGWENTGEYFFELLNGKVTRKQMKLLVAIVWLSLTTYAWEDYDSICGAFYNGIFYLEEAMLLSDDVDSNAYFSDTVRILDDALNRLDKNVFENLLLESEVTLRRGGKIIVSGLGKNVCVCDKFTGTMLSLGLNAGFLHTNSAVHGDMGMVRSGDLVILLSKSGNTAETIYLTKLLREREGVDLWALTFSEKGELVRLLGCDHSLIVDMEHEGDMWDVMPNNSTTINLIILQALSMMLAKRLHLELNRDFKPNHPGGAIGERLRDE